MPISFSCNQCGKGYLVSDGLAGKKAVCKACNNRMTIPGTPASAPVTQRTAAPRTSNGSAPAARPASSRTTTARPVARPEPIADDIYGLDEAPAPLPPMMPRSAGVAEASAAESPVKKKKKKGFFSSGKKKSSGGGGPDISGAVGLIRLIVIVVVVGGGVIGGFGLAGKSDVRAFHQRSLDMKQEMLVMIQGVRDVPSAQAASPKLRGLLDRMYKHLDENGRKKARKNDISAVETEFQPRHNALDQQLLTEFGRIGMIPGVGLALNVEGHINRLAALEQQIKQNSGPNGAN